jgi:hypothetical protein
VDDEQLREEAENVVALVRELPADFARVAESIKMIQRDTVTELRQDARPSGEVLREYLERSEHLLEATPEGRAFVGAQRLIDDPERLDYLAQSLDVVLRQPFAATLPAHESEALRGVADLIARGFGDVNTAQRQASRVIATQVRHHDPLRDRQVDDLLRDVMVGLGAWLPTSKRAQHVDALRKLPRADLGRIRFTLADLAPPRGPEALSMMTDDDAPESLDHVSVWGGPDYGAIAALLKSALPDARIADLFADAPQGARRPVDLVGLLEMAARGELTDLDQIAYADTVRPDDTRQRLAFESFALAPHRVSPLRSEYSVGTPNDPQPIAPQPTEESRTHE